MILISVYNSSGLIGRCDARCYNAKTPACSCDCICGGKNHGAGQSKAEDNTRQYAEQMLEQFTEQRGLKGSKDLLQEINPEVYQLNLF